MNWSNWSFVATLMPLRERSMAPEPHSALYLTDARDLYWNSDFLALIATRTNLASARRVLDAGSGLGHWTRTIARLLSPGAEIIGIDREETWVEGARAGAAVDGVQMSFQQGDAQALPFQDATFDLVTCQTFLMHVRDPRAVVSEMVRVLRPGGRLLLAEPNNLPTSIGRFVVTPGFDLDTVIAQFKLEAVCEKGKHALGLGYSSLGEGIVGLVDPALVDDIHVRSPGRRRTANATSTRGAGARTSSSRSGNPHFSLRRRGYKPSSVETFP
ncbi:MAG: methyltransferase domain-containing protein [Deltaproteobacteria bacterium]|nr:methyltransferase domain-containing protein [Deltaproteobacteria bacterium]